MATTGGEGSLSQSHSTELLEFFILVNKVQVFQKNCALFAISKIDKCKGVGFQFPQIIDEHVF